MANRSDPRYSIYKSTIQQKIGFLEDQIMSLDHYLPETYDYLMRELDHQRLLLAELNVQENFNFIDDHDDLSLPGSKTPDGKEG